MVSVTAPPTQLGLHSLGPRTAQGLGSDPTGAKAGSHSLGADIARWPPPAILMEGQKRNAATGMEDLAAVAEGLVFARDLSLAADRRVAVIHSSPISVRGGRRNGTRGTAAAWGL